MYILNKNNFKINNLQNINILQFAILAGIDEVTNFLQDFKFKKSDIELLKEKFKNFDTDYFDFLLNFNTSNIELFGMDNGSEFFAKEKILFLKGNLSYILLMTSGIKSIISFATLVCTNSIRMRKIAGDKVLMLEFGLRRAQGPMAGNFASKYSYMGSFDGK